MLFLPDWSFPRVTDITPDVLAALGIKNVLLDTDNTLTFDGAPEVPEDVAQWLREIKAAGIGAMILSNNNPARVEPFARRCGLPFIAHAKKPLTEGFFAAMQQLGGTTENTAMIGDQLFTDMWAANRAGCLALFVQPMGGDISPLIRFKRALESPFKGYIKKKRYTRG